MEARQFHRLEVLGSNPSPAIKRTPTRDPYIFVFCVSFFLSVWLVCTAGGCHLFLIYLECIRNKRINVVDSFTSKPYGLFFLLLLFIILLVGWQSRLNAADC